MTVPFLYMFTVIIVMSGSHGSLIFTFQPLQMPSFFYRGEMVNDGFMPDIGMISEENEVAESSSFKLISKKYFRVVFKKFLLIVLPCRVSCDVRGVLYGHTGLCRVGTLICIWQGCDCTLSSDWFISSGSFELTH